MHWFMVLALPWEALWRDWAVAAAGCGTGPETT